MSIIKPPVMPSWADAGDKIQPTNAEVATGWPLSNIPPSRQRFNWILNYLANGIRYFSRRGLTDYDAAETYMNGDRVIGDDGNTYRSLVDNNIGNTPSSSTSSWEQWALTKAQSDSRYALKTQGGNLTVRAVDTVGVSATGLAIIDGVQTVAGDLVLRAVGTNSANIVYVVGTGAWTAYPLANIKAGTILSVQEGSQNADTIWELKTDGNIVIGTTQLNWVDITSSIRAAISAEATARSNADQAIINQIPILPIGSVYSNVSNPTNPATLLGYGTWIRIGQGRVLVGQSDGDSLFGEIGATGGSADAVVVSHTHTATVTDPGHSHTLGAASFNGGQFNTGSAPLGSGNTGTSTTGISVSNSTTGVSGTNANLPPYLVVYMWARTA